MSKKVLITGAHGLLGRTVVEKMPRKFEIIASDLSPLAKNVVPESRYRPLDITDFPTVKMELDEQKPDVIVHCAAMTDVDGCEDEPNKAMEINGNSLQPFIDFCEKTGALLIHISSDYVFDGKSGNYLESDAGHPLSAYGRSKFRAEEMVQNSNCRYAIIRPNTLYGYQSDVNLNFVTWAIRQFRFQEPMKIVTDQISNPSEVSDLADFILLIIEQHKTGIFHHGSENVLSRFEFVQEIAEIFGGDENLISAVTSEEFQQRATRPKNSWLNLDFTKSKLHWTPKTTKQSLEKLKKRMEKCEAL